MAEVRELLDEGKHDEAASRAAELELDPATREVGALCSGIVAYRRGYVELAHAELAGLPTELWSRFAPAEVVKTGLVQDRAGTLQRIRDLLAHDPEQVLPRAWMAIVEPVFGAGESELTRDILAVVDRQVEDREARPSTLVRHEWISRWAGLTETSPSAPITQDVRFAVLDYDHPGRGRASANIGDHVQTLASLGHLVRHRDLTFDGPDDLVDLLQDLQRRVRPDRVLERPERRVQVLTADRDATGYRGIPPDTWTLAFGWYMHALFDVRFGFPFHPNLLPIFVSFHCNKREMLSPEAVEYLRSHGPIGCRDWTTVDILLSLGVPAFFSGCLTSTVSTLFPDLTERPGADAPVAYVDVPEADRPAGAVTYQHSYDGVRFRSFTDNVRVAADLLETYRSQHSAVVTSRLHCYLPLRSLGTPVDFRPHQLSDIRFAGLHGIDDEAFDRMRTTITERLEQVFALILAGASPDEVYSRWRQLTEGDVERARQRHSAPVEGLVLPVGVERLARRAVEQTRTEGGRDHTGATDDPVHVAVTVATASDALLVLVASVLERTSRPVHLWLLDESVGGVDPGDVRSRFPGTTVSVVPVHELSRGGGLDGGAPVTGRPQLQLLLLPRLLPDVDRVLLLPVNGLVESDVADLWELDLVQHPVAAADVVGLRGASGFGIVHNAGTRLGARTDLSTELRRVAHARHVFDFTAFDTAVMVLDLAALRASADMDDAVALADRFGLNARESLHVQFGPNRARVPARWHTIPTREVVAAPALLHWRDRVKPWTAGCAPLQELWWAQRSRLDPGPS